MGQALRRAVLGGAVRRQAASHHGPHRAASAAARSGVSPRAAGTRQGRSRSCWPRARQRSRTEACPGCAAWPRAKSRGRSAAYAWCTGTCRCGGQPRLPDGLPGSRPPGAAPAWAGQPDGQARRTAAAGADALRRRSADKPVVSQDCYLGQQVIRQRPAVRAFRAVCARWQAVCTRWQACCACQPFGRAACRGRRASRSVCLRRADGAVRQPRPGSLPVG